MCLHTYCVSLIQSHIWQVLANNMIPLISMHSWNPLLSGVVSGALQLPLVLAVKDSLGGSTSYCTLVANGLDTVEQLSTGSFVYFKSFLNNWWQVSDSTIVQ